MISSSQTRLRRSLARPGQRTETGAPLIYVLYTDGILFRVFIAAPLTGGGVHRQRGAP